MFLRHRIRALIAVVVVLEVVLGLMPPGLSILDARLHYDANEALSYLENLGEVGRKQYFVHQCVDLVFIAAYTMLFRELAVRWKASRAFAFAPGGADLVETAGILVLLTMTSPRSHHLAALVGYATTAKWLAFIVAIAALVRARNDGNRIANDPLRPI